MPDDSQRQPSHLPPLPGSDSGPDSGAKSLESDADFQTRMLLGVSRTFALTIPQLPSPLYPVVANAYLLCRIADTIEDDPALNADQSERCSKRFVDVVRGRESASEFAAELAALLSDSSIPEEHELVQRTTQVVRITHAFNAEQQDALAECVEIMTRGMAHFQRGASLHGLADMPEMDHYCYVVAGVVGECLTRLFCEYSPPMREQRHVLRRLGVSFGQGLQMTNILKDVWDDEKRGACWLPRDLLAEHGVDLKRAGLSAQAAQFEPGLNTLIAIASEHLHNAMRYTLMIPRTERGLRNFCLWALLMAVLTLRKIAATPGYRSGSEVKISRWSVRLTILFSRVFAGNDAALRWAMRRLTAPLPRLSAQQRQRWGGDGLKDV